MPPTKISIPQKILNAAASEASQPNVKVDRKKVAARCGFRKQESKAYSNALGMMQNKKGWIVYDKETITILPAGFKIADPDAPVGSNKDALEAAQGKFNSPKQKRILEICSDRKVHTRAEIGKKICSDHTKKSFVNILGPLRARGYIEYLTAGDGEPAIRGTEELTPFDN